MGYRIRVLGTNERNCSLEALRLAALPGLIETDSGSGDDWRSLILKHAAGSEIAFIEKNPVVPGELGADELQEFIDEVTEYNPASAALWLQGYLPTVKVIYSFQLLSGTEHDDGFSLLHEVYGTIWRCAGGILQADQEGFSNEQGNTILWQFYDHVEGPWNAAVLGTDGHWINFKMDLGNPKQREAFKEGQVPAGVEIIQAN
jgi:hypothetical protein